MSGVVLPELVWRPTTNESARHGTPHLVVIHRWGVAPAHTAAAAQSTFTGVVNGMLDPRREVSAHVVYGGSLIPQVRRAAQLVEWQRKAWTQVAANSVSYSIESADAIWTDKPGPGGYVVDEPGLEQLARMAAFICHKSGIPPTWASDPRQPGVTRHVDLGPIGGNPDGHTDPTLDEVLWKRFISKVRFEFNRGGFRESWGRGSWPT